MPSLCEASLPGLKADVTQKGEKPFLLLLIDACLWEAPPVSMDTRSLILNTVSCVLKWIMHEMSCSFVQVIRWKSEDTSACGFGIRFSAAPNMAWDGLNHKCYEITWFQELYILKGENTNTAPSLRKTKEIIESVSLKLQLILVPLAASGLQIPKIPKMKTCNYQLQVCLSP